MAETKKPTKNDLASEVVWTGKSDRKARNTEQSWAPTRIQMAGGAAKPKPPAQPRPQAKPAAPQAATPRPAAPPAQPQAKKPEPPRAAPAPKPTPAAPKPATPKPAPKPAPAPAPQAKRPATPPTAKKPETPKAAPAPSGPAPQARTSEPPKPAAKPIPSGRLPSPHEQSEKLAKTVVVSFVDRIKQEATRKGGSLSLDDIAALDEEFAQRTIALQTAFEKTFDEYIRAARSSGADWQPREDALHRLVVSAFERQLAAPGESRPGSLSRRVLPGFFMAMGLMMGPDAMSAFNRRAKMLVTRNKVDGDEPATWVRVMQDPEAEVLRLEALVAIAVHFANPDRRATWFVDMVNNSLAEAGNDDPRGRMAAVATGL